MTFASSTPSDRPVPPRVVGEIVARGETVMMGYWERPEETRKAVVDGWMHTGDGGYMDEDGYVYVVDRIKDMIISGGENVYSAEVENCVAQHPAVAQCAVIGIPDDKWGETVHAVVMRKPGVPVTGDDIVAFCKERIAHYKCPRSVDAGNTFDLRHPPHQQIYDQMRKDHNAAHGDLDEHLPPRASEGFIQRPSGLPGFGHVRTILPLAAKQGFHSMLVDEGSQGQALAEIPPRIFAERLTGP